MRFSQILNRFAEIYVEEHESELCEAIMARLGDLIDVDSIAEDVACRMDNPGDEIIEEIMNRL